MLEFFHLLENLKTIKRTGWIYKNIPQPESISDHMYRMSLLAMSLPNPLQMGDQQITINKERLIQICLVHDLAESIVGDITPHDPISKEEKHKLEQEAIEKIEKMLPSDIGLHISSLFQEYETKETTLSVIAHELDKFEMVLQAQEYEKKHGIDLTEFFTSVPLEFFSCSVLKEWYQSLLQQRGLEK